QPLCRQLALEKIDAGQVAARPGEACDKTEPDRVFVDVEDDGDRGGCGLSRHRRSGAAGRDDHGHLAAHRFGGERRQPIELSLGPAVFDRQILALNITDLLQALAKGPQAPCRPVRRLGIEMADHRHRRLLRARRERPRGRCAAEQRDERAAIHSITSSAMASTPGGMVRPSVLAVLRLMTNSNLVGCSTGKSAGLAPFSILSTWLAARRYKSA